MNDQLDVPEHWFGIEGDENGNVTFSMLPAAKQRGFKNHPIQFTEGQLESIEAEREVFELVNFGGVPQGSSDHDLDYQNDKAFFKDQPETTKAQQTARVRPEFIAAMEFELQANQHKGDWNEWRPEDPLQVLSELQHHQGKLTKALSAANFLLIREHAADVANFAMKIDERFGEIGIKDPKPFSGFLKTNDSASPL